MQFLPVLELVDVDVADPRPPQLDEGSSESEFFSQSVGDGPDIGSRSDIQLQLQKRKFVLHHFIAIGLHELILFDDLALPGFVI